MYASNGPVEVLTESTFSQVLDSKEIYIVEFYAEWCGHCKALAPEYEKAAKALLGFVHLAAVDASEASSLQSKYQVQGFPTILIFGENKYNPEKYEGARTADAMTDGALKLLKDVVKTRLSGKQQSKGKRGGSEESQQKKEGPSDVVTLTDDNFESDVLDSADGWLVEFYAPWCGHCKNLKPEWEKAATDLKGLMKLGAVDATEQKELASKYGIKGFPTIKFFPPGDKSAPIDFDGPRTAAGIHDYCIAKLDEYGIAPEVNEATSSEMIEKCYARKVCVVAVLPHLIDGGAASRNEYIAVVQEVAKKLRSKPLAFVWIQGTVQAAFEDTFAVGGAGYPSLVAISESKLRFSVHRRAFTIDHLTTFLRDVLSGREKTVPFKAIPSFEQSQPWDGSDYIPPQDEEPEVD